MSKVNEKQLRTAGAEIQKVLGLKPPLNLKNKNVDELEQEIKDCLEEIAEGDEFTPATQKVIDALKDDAGDDDGDDEEEALVKKGKATPAKKGKKDEEEDEDEDDEAGDDDDEDEEDDEEEAADDDDEEDDEEETEASLKDQIEEAEDLEALGKIVKANAEFKSLKGKLSAYKKAKLLKADMLALIEDDEQEDDEPEEKPKKGGKAPNFQARTDKSGNKYTRIMAVAEIMDKNPKMKESEIITKADALYTKKTGASSNPKETRSQVIKVTQVFQAIGKL